MSKVSTKSTPTIAALVKLATAAQASAERSIAAIDETTRLVAESNARIATMETKAKANRLDRRFS
jgi:hypothetical protein